MTEAGRVGELDRPGDIRHAADDLAVDEVAEASHAHQERAWYHQRIGDLQQRLPIPIREEDGAAGRPSEQAVRRHAAEPDGGDESRMIAVERPFVERDFDDT